MTALLMLLSFLITLNPGGDSLETSESPDVVATGIELWVDKDEPVYNAGEKLKVFFRVDHDCYVTVYDIEVSGEKSRLFPGNDESGWVEAGKIYELPPTNAEFDYVVNGPEGIEKIVLLASGEPRPEFDDEVLQRKSVEIYVKGPEPAKLRIITSPKRCRIYIEEAESGEVEYIGKAPRTIVIRPGQYIVRIEKLGYESLKRSIVIEPGERRRVFAELWED